jgi:DNA modification methylase
MVTEKPTTKRRSRKQSGEPDANPPLRLEYRSPAELAENPKNWRRHPASQIAALGGVLSEVGWDGACLYNEATGRLIDGHARRKVALEQGAATVPVLVGSWTPEQEAKILATLDPVGGMATADPVALDALLREVNTGCAELQQMLDDLWQDAQDEAVANTEPAGDVEEDKAPEPQAAVVTRPGDVWLCGRHRVLCGDCRKPEDVARVMGGERAQAVLTDPPYGIAQEGVPGDEPENLDSLISAAVPMLPLASGVCVAFASTRTFPTWLDAIRKAGHQFERMLWLYKKAQCTFPWRGWILKSESILVSTVGEPEWSECKPYSHDCYELPEVSGELDAALGWHGSIKPLKVVADILQRITPKGGAVFDGFLGSGTTLIAAEALGRRCFGIEIAPQYVDVSVRRWQNLTHQSATRESDGAKFDDLEPTATA